MPTTTSWNSRCKLLPGLSTTKTSTTHLRGSLKHDNGPLSALSADAYVPIAITIRLCGAELSVIA